MKTTSIVHQNVQCISNKIDELEVFLDDHCDIFCVSEHWCTFNDIDSVSIKNFCLLNHFSRCNFRHGGVSLFVRDCMLGCSSNIDAIKQLSLELHYECVASKFKLSSLSLIVVVVYRSCRGDFEVFMNGLDDTLEILQSYPGYQIVLCGDFNINFLSSSNECNKFKDLVNAYNLQITIHEPTRKQNCLDNICVSGNLKSITSEVIHNGISDHSAQRLNISESNQINKNSVGVPYRQLNNNSNISLFRELVESENWHETLHVLNVNQQYENFANIIKYNFDLAFPIKYKLLVNETKKTNCSWITTGIRISANRLKELYSLSLSGDSNSKNYYNKYKKVYTRVIRAAKLLYNNHIMTGADNKSKAAWTIINNYSKSKSDKQHNIKLTVHGETVTEPLLLATCFNDYFNNVCRSIPVNSQSCMIRDKISSNTKSFYFEPVSENEVKHIVQNLKTTYSSGADNINVYLLKQCIDGLALPLTLLINNSVESGIYPEALKTAKIKPIHKGGSATSIENYRPISILSCFSKVFEKAMANRIINFFDKNGLFGNFQFGFRRGCSTSGAIVAFLKMLYEELDDGNACVGIFLDLTKAFDLVDHEILLNKLYKYGIRGGVHEWFKSYLVNRRHYVEVKGSCSQQLVTDTGVPQGSILGPLLYIIYVNDMIIDNVVMFADDTSLIVSSKDKAKINDCARDVLDKASDYVDNNKLVINNKKSQFIEFKVGTYDRDQSLLISCNSKSIAQTENIKFLGITIDYRCSWYEHIDKLCRRLSPVCYVLRRLRSQVDLSVLRMYYFSDFHSVLSYATIAWGVSSDLHRAFKLQKRAIRIMNHLNNSASCKQFFVNMGIMTLPCIYIYQLLMYAKNNSSNFTTLGGYHNYSTRHGSLLEIPKHKLTFFERNPLYQAIIAYNHLPESLQIMGRLEFQKSVRKLLLGKCYYSYNEYLDDDVCV